MLISSLPKSIFGQVELETEEEAFLLHLISEKQLSKKQLLLQEGHPCQFLYYVEKGVLRSYCLDNRGRESTIVFALKDSWITDFSCFMNEAPAKLYIEAVQESTVYQIHKNGLDRLFSRYNKFEKWFSALMQKEYEKDHLRIIENLTLSAEERYDIFIQKYPQIIQEVTLKQTASYLGITPEFLSVIRKKKAKR